MNKKSSVKVYFAVTDFDEEHQIISSILKLEPTRIKVKGDPFPKGSILGNNGWFFESNLSSYIIEEHVAYLLSKLVYLKEVKSNLSRYHASINCMIEIGKDMEPNIHLSAETMKALGESNCHFDIDYYLV